MANKRILPRKPLEQRSWIALGASQSLVECRLRDISDNGAKLILQTESKLPDTFDLYLTQDGLVGRNCKVVWQTGNAIGLKFVGRAVPFREPVVVE